MATQTIFVDGLPPATVDRPRSWASAYASDAWNWAHSMVLVCPRCQRQWAVLAFEGDQDLHPQGAYCEAHGGGTLFWRWHFDPPLLAVLPEALLRREALLTLREGEEG